MRVLLAVDGSPSAKHAAAAVNHLCPPEELILLHVVDVPQMAYPLGRPEMQVGVPHQVEDALREVGERLLRDFVAGAPPAAAEIAERLEVGRPADRILEVADQEGVELIVLGARGLGRVEEVVLGSVSHEVVAHAHCPVLVLRQPMRKLERILLPLQGPEDAEAALRFLIRHPFRGRPEVTVLHALPYHEPLWPMGLEEADAHRDRALAAAREFVGGVAGTLVDYKIPASSEVILGKPADVILEEIERTGADLVVVGTHGRTGLKRLVLGSVSHAVVHRSPAAVLVVR